MSKSNGLPAGHDLVEVPGSQQVERYHLGGRKRLMSIMDDFSLTLQHALRQDVYGDLLRRAAAEAGVLPKFSAIEMFDYLKDSDDEFYNWLFPFCAYKLSPKNIGYSHAFIIDQLRLEIQARVNQDEDVNFPLKPELEKPDKSKK